MPEPQSVDRMPAFTVLVVSIMWLLACNMRTCLIIMSFSRTMQKRWFWHCEKSSAEKTKTLELRCWNI
jgi:hypothetical protein